MMFVADFETTVIEPVRVWLWAICDENYNIVYGDSIESFFEEINHEKYNKHVIYFHNLKFDGYFILYHLLEVMNYTQAYKAKNPKSFDTLISAMNLWYKISINFGDIKVHFQDSLKKLSSSVQQLSNAYNIEEVKGSIDFTIDRPIGYIPTDEEKYYIKHDVLIVMKALQIQYSEGLTRMTIGSDAFNNYKNSCRNFKELFPELSLYVDKFCRHAYRGGYVYLNPKYANQSVYNGNVYDVNSMYPWTMRNCVLPYGLPKDMLSLDDSTSSYPLFIAAFILDLELKPNGIPCVQDNYGPFSIRTNYIIDTETPITLVLTNVDYELVKENYYIHEERFLEGFAFAGRVGMFDDYVDYWYDVKMQSKGAIKTISKLMLNSLYGKFAKNPDTTQRYPVIDEKTGGVKMKIGEEELSSPVYVPVAAFITAYARQKLIHTIANNYDCFVYCDTDSIHLLSDFIGEVHNSELGKWKHELSFIRGKYIQPKTYILEYQSSNNTELKIVAAGLPKAAHPYVTFDNFQIGAVYPNKLVQRSVPGGCILLPTTHTIGGAL